MPAICSSIQSWVGALFLVVVLSACGAVGNTQRAQLAISKDGSYTLNGEVVQAAELKNALLAMKPANADLVLSVVASPEASYQAVALAMQAAQSVGAHIGLVGSVSSE
jgi:biopolymer transport protein ExbD